MRDPEIGLLDTIHCRYRGRDYTIDIWVLRPTAEQAMATGTKLSLWRTVTCYRDEQAIEWDVLPRAVQQRAYKAMTAAYQKRT